MNCEEENPSRLKKAQEEREEHHQEEEEGIELWDCRE
jgi:hypothetical protein